jgi:hypothetical protein
MATGGGRAARLPTGEGARTGGREQEAGTGEEDCSMTEMDEAERERVLGALRGGRPSL